MRPIRTIKIMTLCIATLPVFGFKYRADAFNKEMQGSIQMVPINTVDSPPRRSFIPIPQQSPLGNSTITIDYIVSTRIKALYSCDGQDHITYMMCMGPVEWDCSFSSPVSFFPRGPVDIASMLKPVSFDFITTPAPPSNPFLPKTNYITEDLKKMQKSKKGSPLPALILPKEQAREPFFF